MIVDRIEIKKIFPIFKFKKLKLILCIRSLIAYIQGHQCTITKCSVGFGIHYRFWIYQCFFPEERIQFWYHSYNLDGDEVRLNKQIVNISQSYQKTRIMLATSKCDLTLKGLW